MRKFESAARACVLVSLTLCWIACAEKPGATKPEPKLKAMASRTDIVLVKHFYPVKSFAQEEQTKEYAQVGIMSGGAGLEPMWVYEPGKEKDGLKGAKLNLLPRHQIDRGDPSLCVAYLDMDELKDLDSALSYIISGDSPWHSGSKDDKVEVSFTTRDSMSVTAFKDDDGKDGLAVTCQGAGVFTPISQARTAQQSVRDAIHLLESK